MTSLINRTASSISAIVLFCLGCVMTAIGLSVVTLLATFAMAAAGIALLASPFIGLAARGDNDTADVEETTPAA